jgi:ribosomal protein L12E/L44/L45/RPP1/RPP2
LFFFSLPNVVKMAEEEPVVATEEVAEEPSTPFTAIEGNDRANMVLSLASALLHEGGVEVTADNLTSVLAASNNEAPESFKAAFASLFTASNDQSKMFEFKVGGGGSGSSSGSGSGAAEAEAAKEPEPESEPEEEVVVSFGGGDDDGW